MPNELQQDSFQAVFVLLWPVIQQWITKSQWLIFKWISPESTNRFKIFVSAVAAFAGSAGFHWNHTAYNLVNGGNISFAIPPLAVIGHAVGAWVTQHYIYNFAIKNPALTQELLGEMRNLITIQSEHLDIAKGDPAPKPVLLPPAEKG